MGMEFVDYQYVSAIAGVLCASLFWYAVLKNL